MVIFECIKEAGYVMKSLDETIAALKGRQKATEKLVPDPGHRYVATSVRTAASSYGACAQVLKSIDRVIRSQRISGAGTLYIVIFMRAIQVRTSGT